MQCRRFGRVRSSSLATAVPLINSARDQWRKAYELAKEKLSEKECEKLDAARHSSDTADSPIKAAEDAREAMKDKEWKCKDKNGKEVAVKDRIEKILKCIDKYAAIVDVGIQHHPDIRSVCPLPRNKRDWLR